MDQLRKDYPFSYEVIKADIDEKAIRHDTPRDLVLALAHAKADAIIAQLKQQQQQEKEAAAAGQQGSDVGLLITCDQVVVHEGQIREKPEDIAEAHRWAEGERNPLFEMGRGRGQAGSRGGEGGWRVGRRAIVAMVGCCYVVSTQW
jgi:septum formation protein